MNFYGPKYTIMFPKDIAEITYEKVLAREEKLHSQHGYRFLAC